MASFRYELTGNWYKGNAHIHSTASDGGKHFSELAQMYAGAGYDFLFRTDHWVASDVADDGEDAPLLWLDGIELHGYDDRGAYYHVVGLGTFTGLMRDMGLCDAMQAVRDQGGILVLAHPHWMGNSFEEALRWDFDGVEAYNHVCQWLNGKGNSGAYWNAMLAHDPSVLGLAVDDAHIRPEHPGWNGGWIVVNAAQCARDAVLGAIRAGNFYSTRGPAFHAIEWHDNQVTVTCSPVRFARLVGPADKGKRIGSFDGDRLTQAAFELPAEWPYAYLEIEDECGRCAWTNSLFV
jgi:hypothetical protein